MSLSLTQLRTNLYQIVDKVIETGIPVEIDRKGVIVKLIPVEKKKKLDNLVKHPKVIAVDPEKIVHLDWTHEWKGKDNL